MLEDETYLDETLSSQPNSILEAPQKKVKLTTSGKMRVENESLPSTSQQSSESVP